ncbi:MAG: ABC transporter ATP-binding protein [Lautropia sp.]
MTVLLQASNLSRRFPVRLPGGLFGRRATLHAVNDVSFGLDRGETLGLVGESGCGKTTTAKLALGFVKPSSGAVRFDGEPLPVRGDASWRELRRRMQMVYQDPMAALDRRMTALAAVREPLDIFGIGTAPERRERVQALLAEVGLEASVQARHPHELSGGQRQRVVLARALATEPALLVADEPISALDVSIQAQVINLLADLQARRGIALLFISHDLKVVRQVSDRVAVMYLGRIVEEGTADALFREPLHPYTRALVSAIPSPSRDPRALRIRLEGDPPNPVDLPSGCAFHPRCAAASTICRERAPVLLTVAPRRKVACHEVGST